MYDLSCGQNRASLGGIEAVVAIARPVSNIRHPPRLARVARQTPKGESMEVPGYLQYLCKTLGRCEGAASNERTRDSGSCSSSYTG